MGRMKKYSNLKLKAGTYINPETGSPGPNTLLVGTSYYTTYVPCKGASLVVFKITGTNATQSALGSTGCIVDNGVSGATALNAASHYTIQGGGANAIQGPGMSLSIRPTVGVKIWHDLVSAILTTAAGSGNAFTNVNVDVEVHYDIEADIVMAEVGQAGAVPL